MDLSFTECDTPNKIPAMMQRNDPCWCGSGLKWKKCHYPHVPPSTSLAKQYLNDHGIRLKTADQIQKIKKACITTAQILDVLYKAAKAGVMTEELDQLSVRLHRELHAIPACLGYGDPPFPKTICTSLNEVICHGIPD